MFLILAKCLFVRIACKVRSIPVVVSTHLSLEPLLVAFLHAEPDLRGEEHQLLLHVGGEPTLQEAARCARLHQL